MGEVILDSSLIALVGTGGLVGMSVLQPEEYQVLVESYLLRLVASDRSSERLSCTSDVVVGSAQGGGVLVRHSGDYLWFVVIEN